jgi:hypothetical protein
MEVTQTPRGRLLAITKQKDGDDSATWPFHLRQVMLGIDDDGDAITSCVVEWREPDATPEAPNSINAIKARLGNTERIALEAWDEIQAYEPVGATVDSVARLAAGRLALPPAGRRDKRLEHARRAVKNLADMNLIVLPKSED